MKTIHNCPKHNLPYYAHSVANSLSTLTSDTVALEKLPDKDIKTIVLSLEVAYEILTAELNFRQEV